MFWFSLFSAFAFYEMASSGLLTNNRSANNYHTEANSNSDNNKSTKHNLKHDYSYKTSHSSPYLSFRHSSDFNLPLEYGLQYASDYNGYVSLPLDIDPDLDPDLNNIDLPLDTDLDLDFSDIDLDLDLLKLKYGLYGLNYFSLHNPHFNDYRFRRRYRLRKRPYYRLHHRYLPNTWKYDLDFWGLDNYSLGYGYNSFKYDIDSPTSYVHVSKFY